MTVNTTINADDHAPDVTRRLAAFVAEHPAAGWPANVEHEAHRTLLNWLGCAIGASQHPAVDAALRATQELGSNAQASVFGRTERVDMGSAALVNGIASHTFDFDDTHLRTIIHPAGPVASAAFALAEHYGIGGRNVIDALVIGIEVECRVGNAIYPDHYDRGWHITGSTGMLGAAAACARLLQLDAASTTMALGIAASQPVGVREQFGSMTKSLHVGAAARVGLTAALMAKHGFTASQRALEAPRGLLQTYSTKCDWRELTDGLGERLEILRNTYKPFACGIVIHPSIDGCIQLRNEDGFAADQIERVDVVVHPLVLELTGKKTPRTGLEGKFSVYHACAAGIVEGRAGEAEFSDAMVARPDLVALRQRIVATVDPAIGEAACDVTIECRDGRRVHTFVAHAIGSLERPLDDAALARKFHDLADGPLGAAQADACIAACAALAAASDVTALIASARPARASHRSA